MYKLWMRAMMLSLGILFVSCNTSSKEFELSIKLNGDYEAYVYLEYLDKRDSVLADNRLCKFKGSLEYPVIALIDIADTKEGHTEFFLEPGKTHIDLNIDKQTHDTYAVYKLKLDTIIGSKINRIETDFIQFMKAHEEDADYEQAYYARAEKIILDNSKNEFSGIFICDLYFDSVLTIEQLQTLFSLLDVDFQNQEYMQELEGEIYPAIQLEVGDALPDFELPNLADKLVSTDSFRGKLTLIDFWATWCTPCLKQFPKLKEVYAQYKDYDFEILGLALDEDKEQWLKANETHAIPWENLLESNAFKRGATGHLFSIESLPYNVLVDASGEIIKINISVADLVVFLEEYYELDL